MTAVSCASLHDDVEAITLSSVDFYSLPTRKRQTVEIREIQRIW